MLELFHDSDLSRVSLLSRYRTTVAVGTLSFVDHLDSIPFSGGARDGFHDSREGALAEFVVDIVECVEAYSGTSAGGVAVNKAWMKRYVVSKACAILDSGQRTVVFFFPLLRSAEANFLAVAEDTSLPTPNFLAVDLCDTKGISCYLRVVIKAHSPKSHCWRYRERLYRHQSNLPRPT